MRTNLLPAVLVLAALAAGCGKPATPREKEAPPEVAPLLDLLPTPDERSPLRRDETATWTALGEQLYDRIDGAAEVFMQFDFRAAVRARYLRKDDPDTYLEMTIYRFGSPPEAFGAYCVASQLRGEPVPGLGHAAREDPPNLYVWADNLLLHLVCSDVSPEMRTQEAMLAGTIADKVAARKRANLPDIFRYLPERHRFEDSEWFCHTALSVRRVMPGFVVEPLGLSRRTDFASAEYGPRQDTPREKRNRIFVIRYPTAEAAERALASYQADPAAQKSPLNRTTLMRRSGAFIVGTWTREAEKVESVIPIILQHIEFEQPTSREASGK